MPLKMMVKKISKEISKNYLNRRLSSVFKLLVNNKYLMNYWLIFRLCLRKLSSVSSRITIHPISAR
jgi:hypothetical protein